MDNNNQTAQTPNPTPNTQPQPLPSTPATGGNPSTSSNKIIMIVVVIIIVVLVALGAYWFLGKQKTQITEVSAPQATEAPVSTESLDQELNSIDVKNPDPEFTPVDTDLQNL